MFGGFKVTLNFLGGKRNEHSELSSDLYVSGAYRVNRETSYGYSYSSQDAPKSKPTDSPPTLRPAKSTGNLQPPNILNQNTRHSNPDVSSNPRGEEQSRNSAQIRKLSKNNEKEQKKIEKQKAAERKKQAQEKAKQEKLREKALKEAQKAKKKITNKQDIILQNRVQVQSQSHVNPKPSQSSNPVAQPVNTTLTANKTTNPPPVNKTKQPENKTRPLVDKTAQPVSKITQPVNETPQAVNRPTQSVNKTPQAANKTAQPINKTTQAIHKTKQPVGKTDTLDSSISRSSGPPPYSELPDPIQLKTDRTGNVVYSKPDTGSWDIISQHREQMSRPAVGNSKRKQVVMDLNYNGVARDQTDNSEA